LQLATSAFESQLKYLLLRQDCFMLSRPGTKVATFCSAGFNSLR
jgi:hypothetical protein